mmetsp:Transcript_37201/g.99955  ORF Transcript_37201/g.99955 Transcript_37201/m.99955 type:complete len:84 (-) Transcript_37201:18-269(-)
MHGAYARNNLHGKFGCDDFRLEGRDGLIQKKTTVANHSPIEWRIGCNCHHDDATGSETRREAAIRKDLEVPSRLHFFRKLLGI